MKTAAVEKGLMSGLKTVASMGKMTARKWVEMSVPPLAAQTAHRTVVVWVDLRDAKLAALLVDELAVMMDVPTAVLSAVWMAVMMDY